MINNSSKAEEPDSWGKESLVGQKLVGTQVEYQPCSFSVTFGGAPNYLITIKLSLRKKKKKKKIVMWLTVFIKGLFPEMFLPVLHNTPCHAILQKHTIFRSTIFNYRLSTESKINK